MIALTWTLFALSSFAESGLAKNLSDANALYDQGKCAEAVIGYQAILSSKQFPESERDEVVLRKAYCDSRLNLLKDAELGFAKFLIHHPKNDEVRLRYAEVLFLEKEYKKSETYSLGIRDTKLLTEARVLAAKAYLAENENEKALAMLNQNRSPTDEWASIMDYWRGVAYYQMFDEESATTEFSKARQSSPENSWTKSGSDAWLDNLAGTRSWIHARINVGLGYDSNIAQSNFVTSAGGSPDSNLVIADVYKTLDLTLSTKVLHLGKWVITPSLESSSWYYNNESLYNPENFTLNTNFTRSLAPKWRFNTSISFLDSRYDWYYYQDYAILNLNLLYAMTRSFSTHISLGTSHQVVNHFGWSFTPSVGIESDEGGWYWLLGLSFTQANGNPAQFATQGGATRVVTGVLDSRYQAFQARAGIGKKLGSGFDAFLQLIYTGTQYRSEGAPPGSAFSLDRRADQDGLIALNLSKSLISKRLNIILSSSYGINSSSGFQGLISNGYAPDYNYNRFLSSLTLAYGL